MWSSKGYDPKRKRILQFPHHVMCRVLRPGVHSVVHRQFSSLYSKLDEDPHHFADFHCVVFVPAHAQKCHADVGNLFLLLRNLLEGIQWKSVGDRVR